MATNGVFDCDSYVLEPDAIWDTYLDSAYKVAARSAFYHHIDPDTGLTTVIVNGKAAQPMNKSRIIRQAIWKPGMTPDQIGELNPRENHPINPGASDSTARLKDMDTMGVDRALLFPTVFAEYFPTVENPDVAAVLARAYNDWIHDFCAVDRKRLFAAAVLPIQDVGLAVAEAKRVADKGFKAIAIRPAFLDGRFVTMPLFTPLWKTFDDLGLAIFLAPSPGSGNPERTSTGAFVDRVAPGMVIGHNIAEAVAPVMDNATALTAMAFFGHMEEYPNLKIGFASSGASWLTLALEKSETYLAFLSNIRDVSLEPEHVFFDRPSLVTFDGWESGVARLHDVYGKVAAWGSHYPRHDASMPQEAKDTLDQYSVPGDVAKALMGGNAERFLGVS